MTRRKSGGRDPRQLTERFAREATVRLVAAFRERAPSLERELAPWMRELAGGRPAHRYFLAGAGYPILQLPLAVAEAVAPARDSAFERDITYSTICGYYAIRLLDDALDGDSVPTSTHLLWQSLFTSEFQAIYARHLPERAVFWKFFSETWFECLERTFVDSRLRDIDFATFAGICTKKTLAARIPVRATLDYYGASRRAPAWLALCDALARFVQMADDLMDWPGDLQQGSPSYFLAEARRRRRRRETTAQWARREGLAWGVELCRGFLADIDTRAERLASHSLAHLLQARRIEFEKRVTRMQALLNEVAPLARHF